jgi:hypothetical protein
MRRITWNAGTMTSERQKAANRANALHSAGPRTQNGKGLVRFNAFRHGLLAQDVVLPGEDGDAFEDLLNQVRANLSPVGPIEEFLVNRVVNAMWRLQARDEVLLGCAIDADAKEGDAFAKLARYKRSLERSLLRALDELRQLQDRRRKRPAPPILDALRWTQEIQIDEFLANLRGAASWVETSFLRNKAISTAPIAMVSVRIIAATGSVTAAVDAAGASRPVSTNSGKQSRLSPMLGKTPGKSRRTGSRTRRDDVPWRE